MLLHSYLINYVIGRTESFSVDSRMNLVGNQIGQYVEFYMPTWSDERTEEERDRINLEGRPRLGEVRSTLMRISQNVEFKVIFVL